MPVEVETRDERTIQVPVPAGRADTQTLAGFLMQAHSDGYTLKDASDIQSGSQRDPYTVGLRITVEKKSS